MREEIQGIVSAALWETGALKVSSHDPFILASGNRSPVYVDCRVLISYPWARGIVTACAHWLYHAEHMDADFIAGGETAGIPFAAWLAERVGKPFAYVRKEPKGHGISGQVVGCVPPGSRVLLYEDLITDGGSKLAFVKGLRQAGAEVADCLVMFDRQQGGASALQQSGVRLHRLTDLRSCLELGAATGRMSPADDHSVQAYLADAAAWHDQRGYEYHEPRR
ncbi:MAG TPA: orotate phosphoribosyltransferase [Armatimonadota bacterium]|nr:orotate phosphoribosyltransferase [Armatimonadota bacterium]